MPDTPLHEAEWRPSHNPWAVALTVTLATFMEVLDTSIANVALPHIAGSLGASGEEATWVLTSYLVSSAVVLPISGWLSNRFGRKRFYMTCVALFTVCSFLCGIATSLPLLIIARVLQGAGGGGLAPSEQAILADTFPIEKRGQAFAVYGMAVVVAPAIGPTLGGWITDNFNWHWIFFINIPIGLFSLWLSNRMVEDPPFLKVRREAAKHLKVDFMGLGLVAIGVGFLEFTLDKGQEKDWFGSGEIQLCAMIAACTLIFFCFWEWNHPDRSAHHGGARVRRHRRRDLQPHPPRSEHRISHGDGLAHDPGHRTSLRLHPDQHAKLCRRPTVKDESDLQPV
jgi:DHA2 family multidrug resistance protein